MLYCDWDPGCVSMRRVTACRDSYCAPPSDNQLGHNASKTAASGSFPEKYRSDQCSLDTDTDKDFLAATKNHLCVDAQTLSLSLFLDDAVAWTCRTALTRHSPLMNVNPALCFVSWEYKCSEHSWFECFFSWQKCSPSWITSKTKRRLKNKADTEVFLGFPPNYPVKSHS